MRDYPPIVPNVLRINSSSSILLDDQNHHHQQQHQQQQQQQQTASVQQKYITKEHDNMNGDINYHHLQHHQHHQHHHYKQDSDGYNGVRQNSNPYIDTISQSDYQSNGHLNVIPRRNSSRQTTATAARTIDERLLSSPTAENTAIQTGILSSVSNKRNNYMLWIVTPVAARYVCHFMLCELSPFSSSFSFCLFTMKNFLLNKLS